MPNARCSRRSFLRQSALAAGAALLAGCGRKGPRIDARSLQATLAPGQVAEVTFAIPSSGDATGLKWRLILEDLALQDPTWPQGLNLKLSVILGRFEETLAAQRAAGTAPDICPQEDITLYDAMRKGFVMPLDPFLAADLNFDKKDMYGKQLAQARYKDVLYALPFVMNTSFICLNRDLFQSAGAALPRGDWRWDDFVVAARQVSNRPQQQYAFGVPYAWYFLVERVWQNGGEVLDATRTRCLLDQPAAVEAVQYWADAVLKDRIAPDFDDPFAGQSATLFLTRRLAMFETTTDEVLGNHYEDLSFGWQLAPLPYQKQKASVLHIIYLTMSAKTKQTADAWRALNALMAPERQKRLAAIVRAPVGRPSANASKPFALAGTPIDWDLVLKGLETGRPLDGMPNAEAVIELLGGMLFASLGKGNTAREAAAAYVPLVNAALKV